MPDQISSYRLEAEIARGGMGIVYRAVHTVFDEVVAVKAIFPELTLNPELRERFLNEAKIQRRLQHPNIVQIREFLIDQGKFYIVMEFIEGETLTHHLRQLGRPMLASEAVEIFHQTLEGLGFAHTQGVIHRDIKPSNIMLTREGVAKLTDFGIARALDTAKLTRTGTALGTPAYMSPEQIQGSKLDHRTDIYSVGIALYEMLTGRVPFERPKDSDSDFPILAAHINQAPTPPSRLARDIPPFIEAAILKALEKRPEDRFASCQEFHAALFRRVRPETEVVVVPQPEAVQPAPQPSEYEVAPQPDERAAKEPTAQAEPSTLQPKPWREAKPAPPQDERHPSRLEPKRPRTEIKKRRIYWAAAVSLLVLALFVAGFFWVQEHTGLLLPPGYFFLERTLSGHTESVQTVAFSPDGRLLASGSFDNTIKLWDVATGAIIRTLRGHSMSVWSVAFRPDGHLLASGGADGTVRLWDVDAGTLKQTLSGESVLVKSVAFSPDGRLLASSGIDDIKLWDVATGALKQTLKDENGGILTVAFSTDGRLLASGSIDHTIKLWDVAVGTLKQTLRGHMDGVLCVAFSTDGRLLASGSNDHTIKLWDVNTGGLNQTLSGRPPAAFSPDARLLASGGQDETVKLWDVATGILKQTLRGGGNDLAFSPDGRLLASSHGKTIKLWRRVQ